MLYAALPLTASTRNQPPIYFIARSPSLRTKSALGPDSYALNVDGYTLLSKENLPGDRQAAVRTRPRASRSYLTKSNCYTTRQDVYRPRCADWPRPQNRRQMDQEGLPLHRRRLALKLSSPLSFRDFLYMARRQPGPRACRTLEQRPGRGANQSPKDAKNAPCTATQALSCRVPECFRSNPTRARKVKQTRMERQSPAAILGTKPLR
jgi:hypothetical protein